MLSRSAMASAGGITSGVMWVMVEVCASHMVTAVTRKPLSRVAPASDSRSPPITLELARLRQRAGERRDLSGLFALAAGDCAGQRVEQQVLGLLANPLGNVVVFQRGRKIRQNLCRLACHFCLPTDAQKRAVGAPPPPP